MRPGFTPASTNKRKESNRSTGTGAAGLFLWSIPAGTKECDDAPTDMMFRKTQCQQS